MDKILNDHKAIFLKLVSDIHIYSHKNFGKREVVQSKDTTSEAKDPKGMLNVNFNFRQSDFLKFRLRFTVTLTEGNLSIIFTCRAYAYIDYVDAIEELDKSTDNSQAQLEQPKTLYKLQ